MTSSVTQDLTPILIPFLPYYIMTAYGGKNNELNISGSGLLCETTYLENVIDFMGPSHKNTLSRFSVIQPKALHFHYFILKVPCFLQFFGRPLMTTILLWGRFQNFFQVSMKKTVFLIFQLKFNQDSQMLLIPQFQTIVTLFLDMT